MSKIGKKPIDVPTGIAVSSDSNNIIIVKGPKGELSVAVDSIIKVEIKDNQVILSPKKETKKANALWGLSRSLVANMIYGVEKGYEKELELQGVGYKVAQKGNDLELNLGFSHPISFKSPEGIEFKVEKNKITVGSSFQNNLLQFINTYATDNQLKIVAFNEPHQFIKNDAILKTYSFTLKGSFTNILQLIYKLEQQGNYGKLISINFNKKKNYKTNNIFLECEIFLQKIESKN